MEWSPWLATRWSRWRADSAVSLASHFPGVQDVVNNIQVDPLSPMDNRSRLQVYRAIYGYPSLK